MTNFKIAGIGGTPRYMTYQGEKIWLGAHYGGGWKGSSRSLSFNMGSGTALPRLNIMQSAVRYEPLGPSSARSLSYADCWKLGYCDAQGYIETLPPDAVTIFVHFEAFDEPGFEVHFGDYRMEWTGPPWSSVLAANVIDQDGDAGNGDHWAIIRIDNSTDQYGRPHNNPRFYWAAPDVAGDYPRISRVVRTDRVALHDSGERWNPDFLAELVDDGVPVMAHLRFMDAMGTNDSTIYRMEDYPPDDSVRMSPWPPEVYTDLCNRLGVDCWICIPHRMMYEHSPVHVARGDGTTTFTGNILTAEAMRLIARVDDLLNDDLKIYVEFSNEYWNSAFDQFHETYNAAGAAGWTTGGATGFLPADFGAKVNVALFGAMQAAYGNRIASRFVRVAGSQASWAAVTEKSLAGPRWLIEDPETWTSPAAFCDAVAIAPYLGSRWIETSGEVADLITRIDAGETQAEIDTHMVARIQALGLDQQPIDWINAQADVTDAFERPLIAYEGGTHVLHFFSIEGVTNEDVEKIAPPLIEFSYSLAHWSLQEPILDAWKARAAGPFDMFSLFYRPNKFGAWGHERALGTDTPGELAKEAWQDANPRWWEDWRDFAGPPTWGPPL